jgi:hypothetical protein
MNINLRKLRKRCLAPIRDFESEGEVRAGSRGGHIFKDNGGSVLAVAHLDSVRTSKHFLASRIEDKLTVINQQLDDRLGAYIILDHLPLLGLNYDVLLTEGEECGFSTAADFVTDKEYNWTFSFDRAGTDVVLYGYDDEETRQLLSEYKIEVGLGSFSDIVELDHLGVKGFNWGCGYNDNHGKFCNAVIPETMGMVDIFTEFFQNMSEIKLPHTPRHDGHWSYQDGYSDLWKSSGCCEMCGSAAVLFQYGGGRVCKECKEEIDGEEKFYRRTI